MRLVLLNMLKPSSDFYWPFQGCAFFVDGFVIYILVSLYYSVLPVPCNLVITCGERANLLSLLCVMLPSVVFSLSHMVSSQVWYLIVSIPDPCLFTTKYPCTDLFLT